MEWQLVCDFDELSEDNFLIRNVQSTSVGIILVEGSIKAILNVCPHAGAPICEGKVSALIVSDGIYQTNFEESKKVLMCPWHSYEFDLETGRGVIASCGKLVQIKSKLDQNQVSLWI